MRYLPLLLVSVSAFAAEPAVVPLWPNGAPGSEAKAKIPESVRIAAPGGDRVVTNVHNPSLTVYLPPAGSATGAAVVIAPGGGHRELWSDHEGHTVAKYLSARGIAGFVLAYRLAREKDSTYTIEGHAFADTQRALRLIRKRATEWSVNPDRIGVMGFSAGGELAALAGSRWPAAAPGGDEIDGLSAKPAFSALIYPAIPKEMPLSKETPPAFLACGENDRQNISQGLPELYLQMKKAGVSTEMHVFAKTGHGFGLRDSLKGPVAGWPARFVEWLDAIGMLKK